MGSASSSGIWKATVDRRAFEVRGDPALADALGDGGARRLELARSCSSCRARRPSDRQGRSRTCGLRCLEGHADAGERAARADGADEAIDLAVRLVPDLGSGRLDMGAARFATLSNWFAQIAPFGSVAVELLGEAARDLHVVVRVGIGHGRDLDELRAREPEHVLLLLALRVGDHDDGAEAQRVADEGEADAGIAGGALDDRCRPGAAARA